MKRMLGSLLLLCNLLSGCGGGEEASAPPPADVTPPDSITTLEIIGAAGLDVVLSWRTPGDDGRSGQALFHDLRYAADSLSEQTWANATPVSPAPVPLRPLEWAEYTVEELPLGTWYFALKTADEVPNWSPLSNVVRATVVDVNPPEPVTDLRIVSAGTDSVAIAWTAPRDDGPLNRAAEYDLRYATTRISSATWSDAAPVEDLPAPSPADGREAVSVGGLAEETTYYFALRSADESGNWSVLSNVIAASTSSPSLRRLTYNVASPGCFSPAWSPDGQQIVFSAGFLETAELYRIPSAGGTPTRLTQRPKADIHPAWSPDGTKIAYCSERSGRVELWVMDAADGANAAFIADLECDEPLFTSRPTWSPDGARLAFMAGEGGTATGPTSIYTVPATGGQRELLIAGAEWNNAAPAWSPEGNRLAYYSSLGWTWKVWVKPLPNGQPYQLTSGGGQDTWPAWSPDGSTIAFCSDRTGNLEVWTIPAAGGPMTQLTSHPEGDWFPAWSPDGRQLAFSSHRSGQSEIWIKTLE